MSNFTEFLTNLTDFNSSVLLPFIEEFFTNNIGFIFVAVSTVFVVVFAVLARLLKHRF